MYQLADFNLETITPEELGEILIAAKKAYYTSGQPIMDDHTYDTLEEVLREKAPYHRLFKKVGNPNFDTGFDKKRHAFPLSSQNKVATYDELVHYFKLKKLPDNTEFVVQPKCDGISLEIQYQNGRFSDAITRGDGFIGDVITQNVVKMKNFVLKLKKKFTGSIRCEIMVTYNDFERLNNIVKTDRQVRPTDLYSNPRNAASGLSQRLDGKYADFCSLYVVDLFPANFKTEMEKIEFIRSLGIKSVDSYLCRSLVEVEAIYQQFLAKRQNYPFEIDGLVIKVNGLAIQRNLGEHDNRPKGQVAYKFPSQSSETRIKNISWQVGPLGFVTPVAEVEPIELAGAIIRFASLANYDLVKKLNINIGDIVEISRRGDVIPHIEKIVTKVTPGHVAVPVNCPSCQTKLRVESKALRCPNLCCRAQILGILKLFCQTLEIKGLSDKTIEKLFNSGKLKLPGDFYRLTVDDIAGLENLGEKSARNILNQIQTKQKLTLVQLFDAAVIPNFSTARIKQVIKAGFDTPEKILNLKVTDLEGLPGFQITLARKIIAGLSARRQVIQSILNQIKIETSTKWRTSLLNNLNFVITGELSIPRKQMIDKIESLGGTVHSAVSSKTDYLLTNEKNATSSKFLAAKKLGIKIINEKEFEALL
ncbi:MAG TPA: NAD-dependent DNA ligase LigA [Candidatus Woesebacteria bacterium]|nr:NAD-dependent DNA ligase LigA [Candidatus Woesebacteria bacterium]